MYHYFLQDHQGNNRVIAAQNGTVEEVNHYYPSGGVFGSSSSVQPYKYNGKELDRSSGLNWHDYGARMYDAALGRWHAVDPMAERYHSSTPYSYCGGDPVNRIDPTGMDYWSTNNPEQIRQFMEASRSFPRNSGSYLESFNFSSWSHSTDGEFLSGLTFNDETNMFYSSYGTVENGVATRVGFSIKALNVWDGGASIEGPRGKWSRKASGAVKNVYPEFDLFFASTKTGWNIVKNIFTSMFRPSGTVNTFDASKSSFTHSGSNKEKMGRPKGNMSGNRVVQKKQIDDLCAKYNLREDKRRELHDLVGGQGYGYKEIEQLVKDFFNK